LVEGRPCACGFSAVTVRYHPARAYGLVVTCAYCDMPLRNNDAAIEHLATACPKSPWPARLEAARREGAASAPLPLVRSTREKALEEALALLREADDALMWALHRSPEAAHEMVVESAAWRARARTLASAPETPADPEVKP